MILYQWTLGILPHARSISVLYTSSILFVSWNQWSHAVSGHGAAEFWISRALPMSIKLPNAIYGDILNWGRGSQSTGIRSGSVPSIRANLSLVQFQVRFPSPHSMRWCSTISTVAQFPHLSVGIILIIWSLTFVGRMLCIILYHQFFQGLPLHFSKLLSSLCVAKVLLCAFLGSLTMFWALCAMCHIFVSYMSVRTLCFLVMAHTLHPLRIISGIPVQVGSYLWKVDCCSVTLDPKYISILMLRSWILDIVSSCSGETVHDPLPSCWSGPNLPLSSSYKVDIGTRNICPFHMNHEIDVFSWCMLSSEGG